MSQAERRELASLLAELEASQPERARSGQYRADPYRIDPVLARERPLALLVAAGCCVVLAAGILAGARAQAGQAGPASPEALDWARVGNWGRTCAGQSLRRASLAGAGLDEALPRRVCRPNRGPARND